MGLLHLLQICGSKLVSLKVNGTNKTGENWANYIPDYQFSLCVL